VTITYISLGAFLALLIVFQVKHFLADYPLQTEYMLGKFKPDWEFAKPLSLHAGVHALFTYWIVLAVSWSFTLAVSLALFDGVVHFVMDRIKAGPKYLGRFKPLAPDDYKNMRYIADELYKEEAEQHMPELARAARQRLNGNKYFWWSLGIDQMVHHLTHYVIIYFILTVH
jgi:hypothetical protein